MAVALKQGQKGWLGVSTLRSTKPMLMYLVNLRLKCRSLKMFEEIGCGIASMCICCSFHLWPLVCLPDTIQVRHDAFQLVPTFQLCCTSLLTLLEAFHEVVPAEGTPSVSIQFREVSIDF